MSDSPKNPPRWRNWHLQHYATRSFSGQDAYFIVDVDGDVTLMRNEQDEHAYVFGAEAQDVLRQALKRARKQRKASR